MELNSESRISVIGYGSWATALVGLLTSNGSHVWWHILNPEVREGIISDGCNPKYISELELDTTRLSISDDINEVVSNGDAIILATPSAYLKKVLEPLTVSLKDKFVFSAIKGIIPDTLETVTDYISSAYGVPSSQLGIVSGPTHAEEVSRGRLSYLTVASEDTKDARELGSRLDCRSLIIDYSEDVYGIEYAGVLKNIYAIAAGLAAGLGQGDNYLAVLISRSADEMRQFLGKACPDCGRNTEEKAYLGDLLATCYSTYSRNRRLGQLIGHGCTVKSALNEMTMIAEGYFSAGCIHSICVSKSIRLPIAESVYKILYEKASPRKTFQALSRTF